MDKLNRETLFFYMGFMDTYDYIRGKDFSWRDNTFNIADWAKDVSRQLKKLK